MERFKKFFARHEHRISTFAFVAGFLWDNLTLTRIDTWFDNLILSSYLFIAGVGIIFINLREHGKLRGNFIDQYTLWLPSLVQFVFGGLFSVFVVFYFRGGNFTANWPFFLLLLFLFIGNEFFRSRYAKLSFQIGVFFIAAFSYSIFIVPVLVGTMGASVFLLSGVAAVGIVSILILVLSLIMPTFIRNNRFKLTRNIAGIYIIFNILYFTNIIPPLPLSLKAIGVYHNVEKKAGNYILTEEHVPWYKYFRTPVFNRTGNEPVFVFNSIYAPTTITVPVVHKWFYFDEKKDLWILASTVKFPINGGRTEGYRGYSEKQNPKPGLWRVDVTTEQNQLIGRIKFVVVDSATKPELETNTE